MQFSPWHSNGVNDPNCSLNPAQAKTKLIPIGITGCSVQSFFLASGHCHMYDFTATKVVKKLLPMPSGRIQSLPKNRLFEICQDDFQSSLRFWVREPVLQICCEHVSAKSMTVTLWFTFCLFTFFQENLSSQLFRQLTASDSEKQFGQKIFTLSLCQRELSLLAESVLPFLGRTNWTTFWKFQFVLIFCCLVELDEEVNFFMPVMVQRRWVRPLDWCELSSFSFDSFCLLALQFCCNTGRRKKQRSLRD